MAEYTRVPRGRWCRLPYTNVEVRLIDHGDLGDVLLLRVTAPAAPEPVDVGGWDLRPVAQHATLRAAPDRSQPSYRTFHTRQKGLPAGSA
jgi:hypothetical protein